MNDVSFRYMSDILRLTEKTKLERWISEIGGRQRRIRPSIGLRRSHEALREPIKFVPAVEVGPNEI